MKGLSQCLLRTLTTESLILIADDMHRWIDEGLYTSLAHSYVFIDSAAICIDLYSFKTQHHCVILGLCYF